VASTPRIAFSPADCELFERYPRSVPYRDEDVPPVDKERFRGLRARLRALVAEVAETAPASVPLRSWASSLNPNGRTPRDLWACVYPAGTPNKSYGLQVAIIVSASGVELCLCLGAGRSQLRGAERLLAEEAFVQLKRALRTAPPSVRTRMRRRLERAGGPDHAWDLRRRWREPAGTSDFAELDEWLAFAASRDGDGASISQNIAADDVSAMSPRIGSILTGLVAAADPLLRHAEDAPRRPVAPAATPVTKPLPGRIVAGAGGGGASAAGQGSSSATAAPRGTSRRALRGLARELHLEGNLLQEIVRALQDRGQVIFYGPPGTGKTYVARKLIAQIAPREEARAIVQFHPSYSYEDFVLGFRPVLGTGRELTYRLCDGPLLRLARRAAANPHERHVMLVDEINRGNLPRIFGELLYLLEYRDEWVSLMYASPQAEVGDASPFDTQGRFRLPRNLWIVGTMNTADRSTGLIDAALRRRFHFVPFFPGEGALDGLLGRWLSTQPKAVQPLAKWVETLNAQLSRDFGRHMQIGHSYFMRKRLTLADVERIWRADIMPFLEERLFGHPDGDLRRYALGRIKRGAAAERDDADDQPR